jgi:chitobiase/beta-hexosaminidase-like protein/beta-propeller repeat-containing protein
VDPAGAVYVSGYANGSDFPTTAGALQPAKRGSTDGFVAKIAPDCGGFVYSTYLGGSDGGSSANDIVADAEGHAYLTGSTGALDFPTVNALQPANAGGVDAFVSKLDPSGAALVYSTYLGGSRDDLAWGIALDATGSAYVTGQTSSADFPTRNAVQPSQNGTQVNAFVTRLSSEGTELRYSTFLGASDPERNAGDYAHGIAVDGSSRAYVIGEAASSGFPTVGAFQDANHGGRSDAFVARIDDPLPAAMPTFKPPGGTYHLPRAVSLSSATRGATIYYTTDASAPTTASARYTRPILVFRTTTIKAIAVAPGWTQSPVASATYASSSGDPGIASRRPQK